MMHMFRALSGGGSAEAPVRPAPSAQASHAAQLARVNAIMVALGVSSSRGSTQIHSRPEAMHRIAPQDLGCLAFNAVLLADSDKVRCDYGAFSSVLWSILSSTDALVDHWIMALADTASAPAALASRLYQALHPALPQARQVVHILLAFEEPPARGTSREKIPVTPADLAAVVRLARKVAQLMAELSADPTAAAGVSPVSVLAAYTVAGHALLAQCERLLGSLWLLLACVAGRAEVDIAVVVGLFKDAAQWRAGGLGLLGSEAYCEAAALVAQTLLTRRSDFHNAAEVAAEVVFSSVARRPPFQWAVCNLLLTTPKSPAAAWGLFRTVTSVAGGRPVPDPPLGECLGLLALHSQLQRVLERHITYEGAVAAPVGTGQFTCALSPRSRRPPSGSSKGGDDDAAAQRATAAQRRAAAKAMSKALYKHIERLGSGKRGGGGDKAVFSPGQLLVLAAVAGMPEADLTDDVALLRRAAATELVHSSPACRRGSPSIGSGVDGGGALDPAFLRLLCGFAYTMPTSDGRVENAPLGCRAAVALYRSVERFLFQEGQFATALFASQQNGGRAVVPVVNPQFGYSATSFVKMVRLLVGCCVGESLGAGAAAAAEWPPAQAATVAEDTAPPAIDDETAIKTTDGPSAAAAAAARGGGDDTDPSASGYATGGVSTAAAVLGLIRGTVQTLYDAHDAMQEAAAEATLRHGPAAGSSGSVLFPAVPEAVTRLTEQVVTLLLMFFIAPGFLPVVAPAPALDTLARMFALRASLPTPTPTPSASWSSLAERRADDSPAMRRARQEVATHMQRGLHAIPQGMAPTELQTVLTGRLVPMTPAVVGRPNRLRLGLLEAYLRSLSSSAAAFSIADDLMLRHWAKVAVPCMTNRYSAAVQIAGHDFYVAPFLARKGISPLFVPTYVALLIPTGGGATSSGPVRREEGGGSGKYGEPSMALVKHFATVVRTACQGLEKCDGTALQQMLSTESSAVCLALGTSATAGGPHRVGYAAPAATTAALRKLMPTSAVLLIVSALFDKLCLLWNATPGYAVKDAQQRFATYYSALANLLQCTNTDVLHRVCASIEAIEVEHMKGSGHIQLEFLKYVGNVVDNVRGNSKKGVAEWFLRLSEKIHKEAATRSKL